MDKDQMKELDENDIQGLFDRVAEHFEIAAFFHGIHGPELHDTRSGKSELIQHVLEQEQLGPEGVWMIGDRALDTIGARANGVGSIGVLWGYIFGAIMNIWFWASFIYPLTLTTFLVTMLNSLWFDTLHAAGNALFLGLFGKRTVMILKRYR